MLFHCVKSSIVTLFLPGRTLGGKGGHREHKIILGLEMLAIRRRMIHMQDVLDTAAETKLANIAKREAFLSNRLAKIQQLKERNPRRIQDVLLDTLPEDPGCVVVDARFLVNNNNNNNNREFGRLGPDLTQAAKTIDRMVAFFAARGMRHVIVVPERAAALSTGGTGCV